MESTGDAWHRYKAVTRGGLTDREVREVRDALVRWKAPKKDEPWWRSVYPTIMFVYRDTRDCEWGYDIRITSTGMYGGGIEDVDELMATSDSIEGWQQEDWPPWLTVV
jgi:hypothetical protein